MDTHARGALAVCLLLSGCQSAMFPSFGRLNRTAELATVASSRNEPTSPVPPQQPAGVRPASYDQGRAADNRRQAIADALEQGRTADLRGQHAVARSHYERVLDLDPGHADAHHALGILADKQGDFRTAESHYLRALRSKPEDANLLSDLGYSYFLQARRHDAEWHLREAVKFDPGHAKARGNLELLFDEQKAFETYRQLLGEREAVARMGALFPQSAAPSRTASVAAPAAYRFIDSAPAGLGTQAAAYHQTQPAFQDNSAWPESGTPQSLAAQRSAMDALRAEMERERIQAAATRQHPYYQPGQQQHYAPEPLTAPPVSADAFTDPAQDAGAWPVVQGRAAPSFDTPAPAPRATQPQASGFDPQYARDPASRGLPQQFSSEPSRTPAASAPYGQWLEQPAHPGGAAPAYSAPASSGAAPEPWPHAPAAAQFDVNREARRIGMEGGSLFAPRSHHEPLAQPAGRPATGAAQAAATSATTWGSAPPAHGPAAAHASSAWEHQPAGYYPPANGWPSAQPPAVMPANGGSPQILITPGGSTLDNNAPHRSASAAWPTDRPVAGPQATPDRSAAPPASSFAAGAASPAPSSSAPYWPGQGYTRPPAASAEADRVSPASYWPNDPRLSGWNGQ